MKRNVVITIEGNMFSSQETADWLLQQIEEAVLERDVVLIPVSPWRKFGAWFYRLLRR